MTISGMRSGSIVEARVPAPTPVISQLPILLAPIIGDCSGEVNLLSGTSDTGEMGCGFFDDPNRRRVLVALPKLKEVPPLSGEDVTGVVSLALRE